MDVSVFKKHRNLLICSFVSLFLGAVIFALLFSLDVLDPTYDRWLTVNRFLDLTQGYVGWEFFRKTPWDFPLGMFDGLSYPIKTSIINTDSIPLLAIFFKLLSPILPDTFQYYGMWGILCYMLNSFFGMLLVRKYTNKKYKNNVIMGNIISILSGAMFALMPVLTYKMFIHTALSSQWLILISMIPIIYSEELNLKQKIVIYGILGFLVSSIHTYYIAFLALIILFCVIYEIIKTKSIKPAFIFFSYLLSVLLTLYVLGFFHMNAVIFDTSGVVEVNLKNYFSYLINGLGRECCFLGTGLIMMLLFVFGSFFYRLFTKRDIKINLKAVFFILLIVVSFIIALSNKVSFDDKHCLFTYPIPAFITKYMIMVRFIGRFSWIVDYTLLLISLIYLISYHKEDLIIFLLFICIIFQFKSIKLLQTSKMAIEKQYYGHMITFNNQKKKALLDNNIRYIHFDNFFRDYLSVTAANLAICDFVADISHIVHNKNIKLNNFYFSKNIKDVEEIYTNNLNNPKDEDLFIFFEEPDSIKKICESSLKYFYIFDKHIFARTVPIIGLEDYEISKKELLKLSNQHKNFK